MKIKTILAIILIILTIFFIYSNEADEKIYLLSLGNNNIYDYKNYSNITSDRLKEYIEENVNINKNINEIIEDINKNKKIQNKRMKNHLVKADLIIITTTSKEDNTEELIKLVREYSKEEILLIGSLENSIIAKRNQIQLININPTTSSSPIKDKNKLISNEIIQFIDENILNKTWNK